MPDFIALNPNVNYIKHQSLHEFKDLEIKNKTTLNHMFKAIVQTNTL